MPKDGSVDGDVPLASRATPSETHGPAEATSRTAEQLRAITIGEPTRPTGPVAIADYDPDWPRRFAREAASVRAALGGRVLLLEHVGSTSVPELAAKPCINMVLVVPDAADEGEYVPALEAAGFILRIREPDWYEHRMFHRSDPTVHLHVFSPGCAEVERMLLFRDRLRENDADRQLYERTKRELAQRQWAFMQDYADAKSAVVEEIMARVRGNNHEAERNLPHHA